MTTRPLAAVKVAAALMLGILLSACGDKNRDFVAEGKARLEKGEVAAAAIEFRNALSADPQNRDTRFLLATALARSGDLNGARDQYLRARELGYDANAIKPALVDVLVDSGALDAALREAADDNTLTDKAARAAVVALRGEALLGLDKRAQAAQAFEAALALDPTSATARLGQARLALAANDREGARKIVAEVVAKAPGSTDALFLSGSLQAAEGDRKAAVASLDQVVSQRPLDFRAYTGLISILLGDNDVAGAEARLKAISARAPAAPPTRYLRALVAFRKGDLSNARTEIQTVLKDVPDNPTTLLLAGQIEQALGHNTLAERYLEKAVGLVPDQVRARQMLAVSYLRTGKVDKAKAIVQDLMKASSPDHAVLSLSGELALAERRPADAIGPLSRAIALDPEHSAAQKVRLAQALVGTGQAEKGLAMLTEAVATDPGTTAALALIGAHMQRKEPDKALAVANTLVSRLPKDPLAHEALGRVQAARKDPKAARAAYEQALALAPTSLDVTKSLASLDAAAGDLASARKRFQDLLAKDPKQEEAALLLAQFLRSMRTPPAEILAVLDNVITANPTAKRARVVKAEVLLTSGDIPGAIDAAQQAIASSGEDPGALYILGSAQLAAGAFDRARTTFGKMTALQSKSAIPHMGQMQAYLSEKNLSAARESAARAAQVEPDHLPARLALVELNLKTGRLQDASNEARAVQTRWPKVAFGYIAESRVLEAQKALPQAEAVLRRGLAASESAVILSRLYGVIKMQKRDADADALAEAWIAAHPKDALALSGLGEHKITEGDFAGAEKLYRKLTALQPNDAAGFNNLAWVLHKLGRPEALAMAEKALAMAPDSGVILDTLGSIQLDRGDAAKAVETLRKAIAKSPPAAPVYLRLAQALAASGKKDDARSALAQARGAKPSERLKKEIDALERSL